MSERTKVVKLLSSDKPLADVLVKGWVRTRRDAKDFSFIEVNDGSCLKNIQVIAGSALPNYEDVKKLTTGSSATRNMRSRPKKSRFTAGRTTLIRCRRRNIPTNICVPLPICVRAPTSTVPHSGFGPNSHTRFTLFSMNADSATSIRRSSPLPTAKAPAKCFR